jgi:hypothetical protein
MRTLRWHLSQLRRALRGRVSLEGDPVVVEVASHCRIDVLDPGETGQRESPWPAAGCAGPPARPCRASPVERGGGEPHPPRTASGSSKYRVVKLVVSAALTAIPEEHVEAARIDGAGGDPDHHRARGADHGDDAELVRSSWWPAAAARPGRRRSCRWVCRVRVTRRRRGRSRRRRPAGSPATRRAGTGPR